MRDDDTVLFEQSGPIAIITLNRPGKRNAVNADLCDQLRAAVDRLEADSELIVGILRGAGVAFCGGMDLVAFANGEGAQILFGPGGLAGFVSRRRKKPIVAAVHGAALAGGFELMLACDLVVAAEDCRLGLPEVQRGLVAGAGGALRLGERLPPAAANEILLTGDDFTPIRAMQLGLINRVVPETSVMETALSLARRIAQNAPLSIAASLELAKAATELRHDDLWTLNNRILADIVDTDDAREGAIAFGQKRKAIWRGQ